MIHIYLSLTINITEHVPTYILLNVILQRAINSKQYLIKPSKRFKSHFVFQWLGKQYISMLTYSCNVARQEWVLITRKLWSAETMKSLLIITRSTQAPNVGLSRTCGHWNFVVVYKLLINYYTFHSNKYTFFSNHSRHQRGFLQ